MEVKLKLVSYETGMLLKQFGFDAICPQCYGTKPVHNGEYLGCDEEYELRAEGRGDEIEYIKGGMLYSFWTKNSEEQPDVCTAPALEEVRQWFRNKYNIHINAMPYITTEGQFWVSDVYRFETERYDNLHLTSMVNKTYEEAIENGIKKVIKLQQQIFKEKENGK